MSDDNDDDSSVPKTKSEEKYPRTPHFPFSPGINPDDIVTAKIPDFCLPCQLPKSASCADSSDSNTNSTKFEIHISEKLDGGNCCLKQGQVFARTHGKPATHESFSAVKALYHTVIIPQLTDAEFQNLEFFGENMAAVHSIHYSADPKFPLPSVFFLFAVRDRSKDVWLGVDKVSEIASRLGLEQPPVLFRGVIPTADSSSSLSLSFVQKLITENMKNPSILATNVMKVPKENAAPVEGFVARVVEGFSTTNFERCVCKCVRANHIQCEDKAFKTQWTRANFSQ